MSALDDDMAAELLAPFSEARALSVTHPCACGCGVETPALQRGANRPRMYATKACAKRVWWRKNGAKRGAYRRASRVEARGRVCRWCQATDAEVRWSDRPDCCGACERAALRAACGKCGGPKAVGNVANHCPRCDPPPSWLAPVIVLDASSDRERTIYRSQRAKVNGAMCVSVADVDVRLPDDGSPLVVELPTAVWLRTRD